MKYWLIKSEPDAFSIDKLKQKGAPEHWDGVRNYQARNMMRDDMKAGDQVFFYHSNCSEPGIVGIAQVATEAYPDHTAWEDPESKYFDPKSSKDNPRWMMVEVEYVRHLKQPISLSLLKTHAEMLGDFALTRRGNRLSIMPVSEAQWTYILNLEQ